ncbi:MAG: hypothetical protein HYR85_11785 [Planctomycetes bacterium]|nr:hypothetical protein [Planctomycetota bacterium]MBI3843965.1 hypothetical protein [Planctomycetota bacterium]
MFTAKRSRFATLATCAFFTLAGAARGSDERTWDPWRLPTESAEDSPPQSPAPSPTPQELIATAATWRSEATIDVRLESRLESKFPALDSFLEETQAEVQRQYRRLFDSKTPLASRRFYEFIRREGPSPAIARFDLPEGTTEDEHIVQRAAGVGAQRAFVQTPMFEWIDERLGFLEDAANWSVVHGQSGRGTGFDVVHAGRARAGATDESSADVKLDSSFSIERVIRLPKEALEFRARYQSIVRVSVFPLEQQFETRSPLLQGKNYDVSAAYTVSRGYDGSLFLVSFNLRF